MNWNKKVLNAARQAAAEGNVHIFYNVLNNDLESRKSKRKRAKMSRKRNRNK